jgi:hypothetical protein
MIYIQLKTNLLGRQGQGSGQGSGQDSSQGSSQEIQELRNMMSLLSQQLETLDNRSNNDAGSLLNRSSSLSRTADNRHNNDAVSLLNRTSSLSRMADNRSNTMERSLSPVLVRNKGRNRKLSPMSHNYKKTLHVSYIFIIIIYILFDL